MGHGAHMRSLSPEYQALAGRLQKGGVAFVLPEKPAARKAWQEIMEILFTPPDAALAAQLPILPSSLESIAKRTGLPPEELRIRLERMADKGLVLDLRDGDGEYVYLLPPPILGFIEFSMMRLADHLPKAKLAQLYEEYFSGGELVHEIARGATVVGRTLVHEAGPESDLLPEVLDWESARANVQAAERLAVTNCYCRHEAQHLGTACHAPLEICLSLGGSARYLVDHAIGREITTSEALEILASAREQGLVHIADNVRERPAYICNCCGCCCEQLKSVSRRHMPIVLPSSFQAVVSSDACIGCGRCGRRCPVGAISLVPRAWTAESRRPDRLVSHVDVEQCLGCGVCTGVCRQQALSMERRKDPSYVPKNRVEFFVRQMMERGRLADLLVDAGAGKGPRFVNAALSAILALPPIDRIAASEQLKSRFVDYALRRS